jgi:YD repeat-containing protein
MIPSAARSPPLVTSSPPTRLLCPNPCSPLSALRVRHRSETVYDDEGRVAAQRANIVQVEDAAGTLIAIDDSAVQTTSYGYDPFGNRTTTTFTDGSYIIVRYDDFGRQTAEMQQTDGLYLVDWSGAANAFIVSGWDTDGDGQPDPTQPPDSLDIGTPIPTRVFEYGSQSRLSAVILPAVEHPDPSIGFVHPRYEYTYNAQGHLVGIRDNVYQIGSDIYYAHGGDANDFSEHYDTRLTWFTFNAQGRQLTRTLPLGVRDEFGITLPEQLPFPETDAARLPFTEYFAYNDLGQQALHVSFEGIVPQFLYDDSLGGSGRLLEKPFFDSLDTYYADPPESGEVWTYTHDAFGRQTHVAAYLRDAGTGLLEPARTESNTYDLLGQLIMVASTEGTIHYQYDHLGRLTRTYTGGEDTGGIPDALDGIAVTDTRYSYDALGRLDAVTVTERFDQPLATPEVTDYVYDLIGNLAQVRLPNGVIADYQYDDLNRLELLRHFRDINSSGAYEAGVDAVLAEFDYDLLPDGRRAGVTEKIWLDDGNGFFDPSELAETRIDWTYDGVGRLVRESYDSHDNSLDYVTDYLFDLVGNRLFKLTDTDPDWVALGEGLPTSAGRRSPDLALGWAKVSRPRPRLGEGLPTSPDQTIGYTYDLNDRLLTETKDAAGTANDRHTVYGYDATQQTSKTVYAGLNHRRTISSADHPGGLSAQVGGRAGHQSTQQPSEYHAHARAPPNAYPSDLDAAVR